MSLWKKALSKTRQTIAQSLQKVVGGGGRDPDGASLEELEELMLKADVPVRLVMDLVADQEQKRFKKGETRIGHLRSQLLEALGTYEPFSWTCSNKPHVIMVVGINGSGKTTTCAKLGKLASKTHGLQTLLGAGDTFRAAGSHQLQIWGERIGCDVVGGQQGADAASVAFDSIDKALAKGYDLLILDTAGRMHTKQPLMEEMKKVKRALSKGQDGAPHETWLVLDASIGQNAVIQAREFHKTVPLSGVIIAKLDGSAKGGFVFSVAKELQVPIVFAGLGEGEDDLVPFDREEFVDGLLAIESKSEEVHT